VSNSIKFTLEGHVIIKCKQLDNFIEFRIEDTGVGISNEDKQNLFKEFGMGKSQADLNKHGSGLGLCISKKIVEKMGGHISIDSQIAKGTTATFTIQA